MRRISIVPLYSKDKNNWGSKKDGGMLLFCFTSLRNFSVKPSPISQPIKIKIETNRDLVHCSFPRLTHFASFFYGFSLAPCDIFLSSDWLFWSIWIWSSRSALASSTSSFQWNTEFIFFFISLLQQLYKEEHIVKFKIPNLWENCLQRITWHKMKGH